MLKSLFPPVCLLLALTLAIVGFSMIALGGPEASVPLHEARAAGDERTTTTLEADLERGQSRRFILIVSLLVGSGVMTIVAFGSMRGPG